MSAAKEKNLKEQIADTVLAMLQKVLPLSKRENKQKSINLYKSNSDFFEIMIQRK